ncbi:MAG TPA: ParA family protein [Planctomycetota bacterium]|nr:ParA family protein [Planctomycetota bacterium]
MKVFASCNQKGGVGKTTFAFHFAKALIEKGRKVLLVDFDSQGNLSLLFGKNSCTSLEIFNGDKPTLTVETVDPALGREQFAIVTADSRLSTAEGITGASMFTKLRKQLRAVDLPWDCAIIDCPPSLGLFTLNALVAADHLVIMSEPSLFSVVGLDNLMKMVKEIVEEGVNEKLTVAGIILNQAAKTTVTTDAVQTLGTKYPNLALKTMIPNSVKVEEAIQRAMPVWEYAPGNPAANAFKAVIEELCTRLGGVGAMGGTTVAA